MSNDQLKTLFDYTKFHIGMYTTLITATLAFLKFSHPGYAPTWLRCWMVATLICFVLAGMGGGAIVSNIPNYGSFTEFDKERLNVFGLKTMTYRAWAHFEHISFWAGLLIAVVSIAFSAFHQTEPARFQSFQPLAPSFIVICPYFAAFLDSLV